MKNKIIGLKYNLIFWLYLSGSVGICLKVGKGNYILNIVLVIVIYLFILEY